MAGAAKLILTYDPIRCYFGLLFSSALDRDLGVRVLPRRRGFRMNHEAWRHRRMIIPEPPSPVAPEYPSEPVSRGVDSAGGE